MNHEFLLKINYLVTSFLRCSVTESKNYPKLTFLESTYNGDKFFFLFPPSGCFSMCPSGKASWPTTCRAFSVVEVKHVWSSTSTSVPPCMTRLSTSSSSLLWHRRWRCVFIFSLVLCVLPLIHSAADLVENTHTHTAPHLYYLGLSKLTH